VVYYLLIVIAAAYPVVKFIQWQSDRAGHAVLGDTPWGIALNVLQIGLLTTLFWAGAAGFAAHLKMAAEYRPENADW